MKRLFILFYLATYVCAAQVKPQIKPRLETDAKGIVKSAEFFESEGPADAKAFFREYLKPNLKDVFKVDARKPRTGDEKHEHYDQYYNGVRVEGGGYNFHFKAGKLNFAHGHYVKIENISTTPAISAERSAEVLGEYQGIPAALITEHQAELVIKEIDDPSGVARPKLAYKVFVEAEHPANTQIGFVDAITGKMLLTEPRRTHVAATGTFATRYSGSRTAITESINGSFRLEDLTRGATIRTWNINGATTIGGRVHITDNDNNWTAAEHSASENDMALDVHWALQNIYDHLANNLGINSFNDNGAPIDAHVHFGTASADRDNAFWDLANNVLLFGDGDVKFRPVASLDAVAHEFGHGIIDFQIGWAYSGNGAAFHEGLADIWGAIFESRIKPNSTNNWRIGEQLTLTKSMLRNLQNTNDNNALDKIADTFSSTQYNNGNHYVRSGVFSHWFYILANGESGVNDLGNSYNVTGLGIDRAENIIATSVFNNWLDNTATYADIRTATINATIATYCNNSPEVAAVTNAWHAVGVGAAYSGTVPSITGNEPICSSQSFSVQNPIAGASLFWSSANTSQMTVSPQSLVSTTTATRANNYSGAVNLNLTLVGSGCQTTVTRTVQVGSFATGQIAMSGTAAVCPGNNYVYTATVPGGHKSTYTYLWTKPSNWSTNYQSTNSVSYYVPMYNANYGAVQVQVNNGCGYLGQDGLTVYPGYGCYSYSGYNVNVYPNTSSSVFNVELQREETDDAAVSETTSESPAFTVEMTTDTGKKVYTVSTKEKSFVVNADHLPAGLYIMRITFEDGHVITKRLIRK